MAGPEEPFPDLSSMLAQLCKRLQWDQRKLAGKIEIHESMISRARRGQAGEKQQYRIVCKVIEKLKSELQPEERELFEQYAQWCKERADGDPTEPWSERWQHIQQSKSATIAVDNPVIEAHPEQEAPSFQSKDYSNEHDPKLAPTKRRWQKAGGISGPYWLIIALFVLALGGVGLWLLVFTPKQPYRILVDARHDYDDTFNEFARINVNGFVFEKSDHAEFSLGTLSSYDALIIVFTDYSLHSQPPVAQFTEKEIEAVQSYVDQGGRVFLVGLGWVWALYEHKPIEEYPLNRIASRYGIFFDSDNSCTSNNEKVVEINRELMNVQHPIASDLQVIGSGVSGGVPAAVGTLRVQPPAQVVISCGKATPILAVTQTQKGKIVALEHPTFIWRNVNSKNYNNYQLLANILRWLVS